MEDSVTNDYIELALKNLISTIGIRYIVDRHYLVSLVKSNHVKDCIDQMCAQFGLPVDINISYVPKGYRPTSNDFQSKQLVKTDHNRRGVGGITAQVLIPSNLPPFGSNAMIKFPIKVKLSEDCRENPESFITVMAHELSHVLLYSMFHEKKEDEYYTDLTAMIVGFLKVMKVGRKVVKRTTEEKIGYQEVTIRVTSFGYLSDSNFKFAFQKIKSFLKLQKTIRKQFFKTANLHAKRIYDAKILVIFFTKYLDNLADKNLTKISTADLAKINKFYQPGYVDSFHGVIKSFKDSLDTHVKLNEKIKFCTEPVFKEIVTSEAVLVTIAKSADENLLKLKNDLNILKKYVDFPFWLRLKFAYYKQRLRAGLFQRSWVNFVFGRVIQ